jgi:hypothetical protein
MSLTHNISGRTETPLPAEGKTGRSGKRAAREMLLLCATSSVAPERKERISQLAAGAVDWKYVLELAEFHNIAPLIARNLAENIAAGGIPQAYLERFDRIYKNSLYRSMVLSNELANILMAFSRQGIAAIVLKGTTMTEQLYGNPGLRIVSDIDILLKLDEIPQAESILRDIGYLPSVPEQEWEHPFHRVPYFKQAQFLVSVEIHWNLDDARLITIPQKEIWSRAQPLQMKDCNASVLSPEDTLLFLSNNLSKPSNQLLRCLCDIAELLKKYKDTLDWDYIVRSARSWGIEKSVYYSLKQSAELPAVQVPDSVMGSLKPNLRHRWLLAFFTDKRIFTTIARFPKLKTEISIITRSLMSNHIGQTAMVLTRYHSDNKRGARIRTIIWVILVSGAALVRNICRPFSGRQMNVT